jgi:hypothetical protein
MSESGVRPVHFYLRHSSDSREISRKEEAMRYALLISRDESTVVTPEEREARLTTMNAWIDRMLADGVVEDRGLRLQPTATATTVRVRAGEVIVADGPFAETKEQIGGFFVAECADLDEAIAVVSEMPAAQWSTIEVRPVWET